MAVTQEASIRVTRWQRSQYPSISAITHEMKQDGLRPYTWKNAANHRLAVRSHNYDKVLYVLDGSVEVLIPDINQRVLLKTGDRIDIPAGTRHSTIVGHSGASCMEAAINRRPATPQ